ncbi:MAG: hypothetical protein QOG45_2690, partial [Chloroflexota bacterium]|nr:hypothetical protein [Chloroflexota bacterium]
MITPVELFSRVLGLLEQPDWPAARAFVAAHAELLSPGADAALDVVLNAAHQATGPQRRPLIEGLERLRGALRRSRDVGVEQAFSDAAAEGPYDVAGLLPPDFGLITTLFMFVHTETWEQSRAVVELHPELLDSHTDAVLDGLIAGVEVQEGSAAVVEMLRAHQQLLRKCRDVGVAAFEELTEEAPADPLREAIAAFLASPTPLHAQRQLAEHPDAVSERGVAMLERLVEHAARVVPDAVAETMRARLALLRRCVEIGVEAAFAEETGGLPHASELDELMIEVMSTGGREDVAQLLREHPDLLHDESGEVLDTLRAAAHRDGDADTLAALGFLEVMRSQARTRPERDPDPDELTVLAAVHAFISADTWPASRRIVDDHPELLGDPADRVLTRLEREARAEGQPGFADLLRTHRRLLARCREIGVREAFAELGRGGDEPSAAEIERMLQESLDELTDAGAPAQALVEQQARTAYFLFERHQATGALDDLDVAVRCLQEILRTIAPDDEGTAHHQHFLGKVLATRYALTHQAPDIAAAADAFRRAVAALPSDSPALPATLTDLAHAQLDLHKHTEEPEVLDEAVDTYRRVLAAGPDPVDLAGSLGNLAEALRSRHARSWSAADEEEMITTYRRAAEGAEPGTPMWFDLRNNLGIALEGRFEHRGEVADLDEAIGIFDTTVPLLRDDAAERAIHLGGRGNAWRRRHRHDQAVDSIDRAVADYRTAAAAAPAPADRGTHRLSLANALIDRFHLLGELPDLDAAIDAYHSAVTLLSRQDDRRAGVLTSLANAYSDRWDSAGEQADLAAAIETQEQAVALTRRGSEDWPGHLSNLGNRYLARFDAAGDVADVDTAIRHQDDAVAATPATSDELPRHLNNLAIALRARYDLVGDPADLDRTVEVGGRAVMAAPAESPDLAGLLTTWGSALIARYRRFGRLPDLATANDA